MDLRQLRYFLAISEAGSITRASSHIGVAQPALSLHIKTMEEELGTPLLIRSKAGVTPTEAGRLLIQRARAILDDVARTEDDIRTLDADPMGEVRIGLPGTISNIIAMPLIKAARARYPRIRLNIAEAMSGFISGWLEEGIVDLAVLYEPSRSEGIASTLLLEEELVVLWPQETDHLEKMSLTDIRDVPVILPSGAHGLRNLVDRACSALGFAPKVAMEIDSYTNIKRLVSEGFGASILPAHAVLPETLAGTLVVSHISSPGLWRGAWLAHPSGRCPTRATEAIMEITIETIQDLQKNGTWVATRNMGAHH